MRRFALGFLLNILSLAAFATPGSADSFLIAQNNIATTPNNSLVNKVPSNVTEKITAPPVASAPVDPHVSQETQGMFQNTANNLNLYVTQLQCQSSGTNTNSCNSQNNTTNQPTTVMDNVNKFLFNSVSSELGVGVEVHF